MSDPSDPTGDSPDAEAAPSAAPTDVTAVLGPAGQHDPASVRRVVQAGGYGDVWLRARPLGAVNMVRIELFDAAGVPRLDANLVARLSERGQAAFLHRNSAAGQALLHLFTKG